MTTSTIALKAPTSEKWYVIRTKPRSDNAAVSELTKAGFQAFSAKSTVRKFGSKLSNKSSLFPGYIFLKCSIEDGHKPSLKIAPHASHWINFDGTILAVPDDSISNLKIKIEEWDREGGLWQRFEAGDRVQVAMQNINIAGEIQESTKSPDSKVKVLLQLMDRLIPAQVPYSQIQVSNETHKPPRRTRGRRRWIEGYKPNNTAFR